MSILILGMEMPKDREINLRIDEKGEVYVYGSYPTELHKAVPVPPHGRLIDAGALEDELVQFCKDNWVYNTLHHAPTIIQAEEE